MTRTHERVCRLCFAKSGKVVKPLQGNSGICSRLGISSRTCAPRARHASVKIMSLRWQRPVIAKSPEAILSLWTASTTRSLFGARSSGPKRPLVGAHESSAHRENTYTPYCSDDIFAQCSSARSQPAAIATVSMAIFCFLESSFSLHERSLHKSLFTWPVGSYM